MKKTTAYIYLVIILVLSVLFIAKFAAGNILKSYIKFGIGDCQEIPILCKIPTPGLVSREINNSYKDELVSYDFPKIKVYAPRGFDVYQQLIKKKFYKKWPLKQKGATMYFLYEPPGFFSSLFPQVKKLGIDDNLKFIKQVMFANLEGINDLNSAFFVILKSIFIPDLGDQNQARMIHVRVADKQGILNFNLTDKENYFDCNFIDSKGGFIKIYIKDKNKVLDLEKVLAIVAFTRAQE